MCRLSVCHSTAPVGHRLPLLHHPCVEVLSLAATLCQRADAHHPAILVAILLQRGSRQVAGVMTGSMEAGTASAACSENGALKSRWCCGWLAGSMFEWNVSLPARTARLTCQSWHSEPAWHARLQARRTGTAGCGVSQAQLKAGKQGKWLRRANKALAWLPQPSWQQAIDHSSPHR